MRTLLLEPLREPFLLIHVCSSPDRPASGCPARRLAWRDPLADPLAADLPGDDIEAVPRVDRGGCGDEGSEVRLVVVAGGGGPPRGPGPGGGGGGGGGGVGGRPRGPPRPRG